MIICGKTIAKQIEIRIAQAISHLTHRKPGLAFILVGDHPASQAYVKMKKRNALRSESPLSIGCFPLRFLKKSSSKKFMR